MATYFEVINNNNKVCIDDQYRYLYKVGVLDLSAGANSPTAIPTFNDITYYAWYSRFLSINTVEKWLYCEDAFFLSRATCPRYMVYIKKVNKNSVFGIRFKQASNTPKIYVRLSQTPIGCAIAGKSGDAYIMIEVMSSDKTTPINNVGAYLQYFEIVEIGNSENLTPVRTNYGLEINNANGELIFTSNYNMVNVMSVYGGNIAGTYTYNGFTTNHIVVPNKSYNYVNGYTRSSGFDLRFDLYKDFFSYNGSTLSNSVLLIGGNDGYYDSSSKRVALWDSRDMGGDTAANKLINGLIVN